uniref:Uncharacterized protein n=1 Tax=Arundo donax TaxID=35708 RepID=A0A0A9BJF5_ARUDO
MSNPQRARPVTSVCAATVTVRVWRQCFGSAEYDDCN